MPRLMLLAVYMPLLVVLSEITVLALSERSALCPLGVVPFAQHSALGGAVLSLHHSQVQLRLLAVQRDAGVARATGADSGSV